MRKELDQLIQYVDFVLQAILTEFINSNTKIDIVKSIEPLIPNIIEHAKYFLDDKIYKNLRKAGLLEESCISIIANNIIYNKYLKK